MIKRKWDQERNQEKQRLKLYRGWLQTMFPVIVAHRCIVAYTEEMKPKLRHAFESMILRCVKGGFCDRYLFINELWQNDKSLTKHWCTAKDKPFHGVTQNRNVYCAQRFAHLIDQYGRGPMFVKDPKQTMLTLLEKCVPYASRIFCGNYEVSEMLHLNDYVLEKTFVYAILCLSKWLGKEVFPQGIYLWPPIAPPDLYACDSDVVPVPHEDEVVPSPVHLMEPVVAA